MVTFDELSPEEREEVIKAFPLIVPVKKNGKVVVVKMKGVEGPGEEGIPEVKEVYEALVEIHGTKKKKKKTFEYAEALSRAIEKSEILPHEILSLPERELSFVCSLVPVQVFFSEDRPGKYPRKVVLVDLGFKKIKVAIPDTEFARRRMKKSEELFAVV